jgi:acyl-coenzyme A synthetase/AMP-(fatty) acid ligase
MNTALGVAAGIVAAYFLFLALRLGLHQRLPLAFGPISLEGIPDRAASLHGDRPLFTCDSPVSWRVPALIGRYMDDSAWSAARVRSTAAHLATMWQDAFALCLGERVAILKQNHLDVHLLIAGVVRAGGIACPMNAHFAAADAESYVANLGARILVTDTATLARLIREGAAFAAVSSVLLAEGTGAAGPGDAATVLSWAEGRGPAVRVIGIEQALGAARHESRAVPRGTRDPIYLVHSSGTTGFPKAVVLRNGAQSHAVRGWLCYVHLSRTRDRGYVAVPNNHQAVILTFNSALLLGLPTHWDSSYGLAGFEAGRVISALARGKFTGYFGFPITYTQMKEADFAAHDLSRMRVWASTADASHEAIIRPFVAVGGAFRSVGIPIDGSVYLDAQGSSEVGTPSVLRYVTRFTTTFARRIGKPGSTPFGPDVRIARDGVVVRRGEVGRLEVKGKTVLDAYWNNQDMTRESIRDGWFFTGDVARQEADGHLIQLDREVDVIHTAHGPVYSLLIEEAIHQHPAVFDACVYGARQPDGTQSPAAAIALRPGNTLSGSELRTLLNGRLGPGEQLTRVDVMDWSTFPIGLTGKTLKRVFRERTEPVAYADERRPRSRGQEVRRSSAGPVALT